MRAIHTAVLLAIGVNGRSETPAPTAPPTPRTPVYGRGAPQIDYAGRRTRRPYLAPRTVTSRGFLPHLTRRRPAHIPGAKPSRRPTTGSLPSVTVRLAENHCPDRQTLVQVPGEPFGRGETLLSSTPVLRAYRMWGVILHGPSRY